MLTALCAILSLAYSATAAKFYSDNEAFNKFQFDDFKKSFSRNYATKDEESLRYGVFLSNLKLIDERNAQHILHGGRGAVHGINKFADMSQEEFKEKYLTMDVSKITESKAKPAAIEVLPRTTGLVDWTGIYTTPVKNQGSCGSCWAFSATEQLESDSMRQRGSSYILSPQQITACDPVSYGCSGGWPSWAFDYVYSAGGQEQEVDYPYVSGNGMNYPCTAEPSKFKVSLANYYKFTGNATVSIETQMAGYVQTTGPLSICVDASTWSTYTGACVISIRHTGNIIENLTIYV